MRIGPALIVIGTIMLAVCFIINPAMTVHTLATLFRI
jgi:hypothetical protein